MSSKKPPMFFGDRLFAERRANGLTQERLGTIARVGSGQWIGQLEQRADPPTIDVCQRLAAVLKVRWEWLATGEGKRTC